MNNEKICKSKRKGWDNKPYRHAVVEWAETFGTAMGKLCNLYMQFSGVASQFSRKEETR